MRTPLVATLVAALGLASVPAVASSSPTATTAASKPQLKTRTGALGKFLVDGSGRTLYMFTKDTKGKSACSGACAKAWPAFVASGKVSAGAGVTASKIGSIKRGSSRQVTYNGYPLYRYTPDGNTPGTTTGQGVGKVWWMLSPSGKKITATKKSEPTPTTTPTTSTPTTVAPGY